MIQHGRVSFLLSLLLLAPFGRADEGIALKPSSIPPEQIIDRKHPLLSPRAIMTAISNELPRGITLSREPSQTHRIAPIRLGGDLLTLHVWNSQDRYHYAVEYSGMNIAVGSDDESKPSPQFVSIPITLGNQTIPFFVQAGGGEAARWVRYFISEQMSGTWQVDNRSIKIALIDYSQENRYSSPSDVSILLDVDEDGEFDLSDSSIEILQADKAYQFAGQIFKFIPQPDERSILVQPSNEPPLPISPLIAGKVIPDFSAADFDGKIVKLSDFRGKFVLIDIWATWCGPCVAAIPTVQAAATKYKDAPLVVIGVSVDDDKQAAIEFIKSKKLSYLQLWSAGGKQSDIYKHYQIVGIPTMILIDPEGKLISRELSDMDIDGALSHVATYDTDESKRYFREQVSQLRTFGNLVRLFNSAEYEKAQIIVDDALARGGLDPKSELIYRRFRKALEFEKYEEP